MIIMEFEELKKIWDVQTDQPLFAINEKAMYNLILSKKKQAHHITNTSELLIIIVYIIAGSVVLGMNLFDQSSNISMYILSVWMLGSGLFMLMSRSKRIKGGNQFDRSMSGDLDYAISVATYQVRISQIMLWNILPIGILTTLGLWEGGKPIWIAMVVLLFFALSYYAGGWEHNIYKRKKRELELLKNKLASES
jgi:amino acid transporter